MKKCTKCNRLTSSDKNEQIIFCGRCGSNDLYPVSDELPFESNVTSLKVISDKGVLDLDALLSAINYIK